jgi:hypothetical protein
VELCASPDALEAFFATDAARAPAQARLLLRLLEHPDGRLPRRACWRRQARASQRCVRWNRAG